MQKLTDHVYGILKFGALMNAYVIDNNGALTIVDTGYSAAFAADIEHCIQSMGKSLNDVQQIFITHCHVDHIGGLAALQQKINVPTYAHRLDAAVMRGDSAQTFARPQDLPLPLRLILPFMPAALDVVRVDVALNGDETLEAILPGAKVIHLPGHSFGQAGLWLENEKTLLAGDAMMHYPWGLRMPFRMVSPDWNAAKASIRKIADMNVQNLGVGHGKPLLGNAAQPIGAFARRL